VSNRWRNCPEKEIGKKQSQKWAQAVVIQLLDQVHRAGGLFLLIPCLANYHLVWIWDVLLCAFRENLFASAAVSLPIINGSTGIPISHVSSLNFVKWESSSGGQMYSETADMHGVSGPTRHWANTVDSDKFPYTKSPYKACWDLK
jgi:hypothetical protein